MQDVELEEELHRTREQLRTTLGHYEEALAALKESNAELDALASELRASSLLIEQAEQQKDDFLATLSHELRNPLTPLRVAFDVARLTTEPSRLQPAMSIMDRQLRVLSRLVDDLLDVSRVARGKLQLERTAIEPARLLEAAVDATRPLLDELHHTLVVDRDDARSTISGDFMRLTQVLVNLLTNAAKYTPAGGRIELAATTLGGTLRIAVRDNGIGIASDILPRVFDLYVQAREGEHRSRGGLGIGLNLVRRLVELHGGRVSAASEGLGQGSTFTVELPLAS